MFGQELERVLPGNIISAWHYDTVGRATRHAVQTGDVNLSGKPKYVRQRSYAWEVGAVSYTSGKVGYVMDENNKNAIKLFENKKIRTAWDEEKEEWLFSVVDVIGVLTDQLTQRGASNYWAKLKERLKDEGANQLLTNCQQLKMKAADGKMRLTDVVNTDQLLRIIQSVPSPKAEPFKCGLLW